MSDKIIIRTPCEPYISIPQQEYDRLKQCEQELLALKNRANNEMQNHINSIFQETRVMQQLADSIRLPINNWF